MEAQGMCVLCCLQFPRGKKGGRRKAPVLTPAVERFLVKVGSVVNADDDKRVISTNRDLLTSWVCYKCLGGLEGIVLKKEEVDGVEQQVRKLQETILRMQREVIQLLRELEETVEGLRNEKRKMEDVFGEESELQRKLAEFMEDEEEDRFLDEVILFRRVIAEGLIGNRKTTKTDKSTEKGRVGPEIKEERFSDNAEEDNDMAHAEDLWFPEHGTGVEDQICQNYNQTGSAGSAVIKAKRTKRKKDRKSRNKLEGTDSSEDDNDVNLRQSHLSSKKYKKVYEVLAQVSLAGMSEYKRMVITRVLRRCEQERQKREAGVEPEPDLFDDVDPLKTHSLTYDPTTDTLNLGGYQLTINEEKKCAECSTCGFQCPGWKGSGHDDTDRQIYNHVFGFHLNLFQCPHCLNSCTNLVSFRRHVLGHRNAYTCDICGKPMNSTHNLNNHKWLHMNPEEKQEAIRNGKKPRKQTTIRNPLQCSICGMKCRYPSDLATHEKTHQEPEQTCATCGKQFRDISYHQKFVCYPGKEEGLSKEVLLRFHCSQCPRKFALKKQLKAHQAQRHSDVRPFQCDVCGKAFKTKMTVKLHQVVHTEERPFLCGKGCGAGFKSKNNVSQHEKHCGGHSGIPSNPVLKKEPDLEYNYNYQDSI